MRRYLLCLLSITLVFMYSGPLKAQNNDALANDTLIVWSKEKKKGLYRTYYEFQTNSPSISYEALVKEKKEFTSFFKKRYRSYQLIFQSSLPCEKGTPIWGFCDGKEVYIARADRFKKKNKYDKVLYLGRYIYYKAISETAGSNMWMPMGGGGMMMGGGKGKRLFEYCMDINTGNAFELTLDELKMILSKDKVLLVEFEQTKKKRRVLGEYLIKYAEKHKDEIEQ